MLAAEEEAEQGEADAEAGHAELTVSVRLPPPMAPTTTVPECMPSRMRSGLDSFSPLLVSSRFSFGSAATISSPASTACCAASGSDSG